MHRNDIIAAAIAGAIGSAFALCTTSCGGELGGGNENEPFASGSSLPPSDPTTTSETSPVEVDPDPTADATTPSAASPPIEPPDNPPTPDTPRTTPPAASPEVEVLEPASSLTQGPITWEFDQQYTVGRFANGEHYVVAQGEPARVRIVGISPESTDSGGRVMNGSMVNPDPRVCSTQGYDSAAYTRTYGPSFDPALNVALGVGPASPLELAPGDSLISSISIEEPAQRPQLQAAELLTIVAAEPAPNSFRPPYVGGSSAMSTEYTVADLDYTVLPSLAKPPSAPSLASVEALFERFWLDHVGGDVGRYLHPADQMSEYGRDMTQDVSEGALSLLLDYSAEEKRTLYTRLVQLGIDNFGVSMTSPETDCGGETGVMWEGNGGHNTGRKLPILIAGVALGDPDMLAMVNAEQNFIFQEDRQTWYVTESDVGRSLFTGDGRPREKYLAEDVGMAEWGEQHMAQENRDGRNWDARYRILVGAKALGHALAARLLGAEEAWNHPAFFDYIDRFAECEKDSPRGGTNDIPEFDSEMWDNYRGADTYCASNAEHCRCP